MKFPEDGVDRNRGKSARISTTRVCPTSWEELEVMPLLLCKLFVILWVGGSLDSRHH